MKFQATLAFLSVIATCACSREGVQLAHAPSANEIQADTLLNSTFRLTTTGDWCAVNKLLGSKKLQLVQLHGPRTSIYAVPVTETDRMNGVSQRFKLVVECSQSRTWDRTWTPWIDGTAGRAQITNTFFPSAAIGFWVIQFEQANGQWHTIKIKLNVANAKAYARSGFFAK